MSAAGYESVYSGVISERLLRDHEILSLDMYGSRIGETDELITYEFTKLTHSRNFRITPKDKIKYIGANYQIHVKTFNGYQLLRNLARLYTLSNNITKFAQSPNSKNFLGLLNQMDPGLARTLSGYINEIKKGEGFFPIQRASSDVESLRKYAGKIEMYNEYTKPLRKHLETIYQFIDCLRDHFYDEPSDTISGSVYQDTLHKLLTAVRGYRKDITTKLPISVHDAIREYKDLLNYSVVGVNIYYNMVNTGHCLVEVEKI